jgi:hypothetical protein
LLAAAAMSGAGNAGAGTFDGSARARAEASCASGEQAAQALRFAEALAAYRAAQAADASAPCAALARARADDLAAHAEGDFGPLTELETVRRDPRKTADRAAIEALARDLEAFPAGRVRVEARLVVAEAWWQRLGEPERAIAACEAAAADRGGDRLTRALALSELWTLRRQRGEVREALAALERDPDLSPSLTAVVRRAARRVRLRAAALVVLGALAAIGGASLARLLARARDLRELPGQVVRPVAVAFSLYLGGAAAVVVRLHGGEGDARPFLWLGLAVLAMAVIARAFGIASGMATSARGAAARATWAAACVAGVLAAAFLAVERTDESFLEGLGL